MKTHRIKRFSILQTGKLLGILYGFLALIMLPFILIPAVLASSEGEFAQFIPMLVMMVLYPVMGFIGGIIGAAVYNLCSKWVGGLEFELESITTE